MLKKRYEILYPLLNYEDGKYQVVIPRCVEDFIAEGRQQDNCVASQYLDCAKDGTTNICFIRKKENLNKSYITCEVTCEGRIRQFLLSGNNEPHDTNDLLFKIKFQEILSKRFKERGRL